jgi:dTDP-glucose 4,6-dehydratase
MRLIVTGGAGFIGSNFIRYYLAQYSGDTIINLDALTYAGNLENLRGLETNPRYAFIHGDIRDRNLVFDLAAKTDAIINFAAESHVDRSINDPGIFIRTNIEGTQMLLDASRTCKHQRYLQVSTDEVYGSLGDTGSFTENTPLAPNSPYSASKAGADFLVRAGYHTFGLPVLITRCSNNYGPYQFPEKLIPLLTTNLMEGKKIPVYGDGCNIRDWLHVMDHCSALAAVLHRGRPGEVYNIGGNNEWKNIDIARTLLRLMGKDEQSIEFVKDRPGHDRRYAIDSSKIQEELNWTPSYTFDAGLAETVAWYKENERWWKPLKERAFVKR